MDPSKRTSLIQKFTALFTSKPKKNESPQEVIQRLQEELEEASGKPSSVDEIWLVKRLINFGKTTARQIMKSRMDMVALDLDLPFEKVKEVLTQNNFSRYPVYRESIDKVEGVLYIKDLLPHFSKDNSFVWPQLVRPCEYVPESKKIEELLKDFQLKRNHIAIVVDEYGGTSGLVTLEDIIEEIVGEIHDEYDDEEQPYLRTGVNTYLFEAKVSIMDFCNALNIDSTVFDNIRGESESLGGLVISIHQDMPEKGDRIAFENFVFVVEESNDKRIERISVEYTVPNSENE
jgi:CBS domain containing-hemolysin-like protein